MRKLNKKMDGINFILLDDHFFYRSRIDTLLKNKHSNLSNDIMRYNSVIYCIILCSALITLIFGTIAFLCWRL